MNKILCLLLFSVLLLNNDILGQQNNLLSLDSFLSTVKANHPIAKIAALESEKAAAYLTSAKSGFDPELKIESSNKTFGGNNYYQYYNPELRYTTPFGIDVRAGIEENKGNKLSSEESFGQTSYLGIEASLGKGFLIDKKRATLQQAKILLQQSKFERQKILNDLLLDAKMTYRNWTAAYKAFRNYANTLQLAKNRQDLIVIAYTHGDRSVMDTIESYSQYQQILLLQNEAAIKLNNAKYELLSFLWKDNDTYNGLTEKTIPDTVEFGLKKYIPSVKELLENMGISNPSLASYDYKLKALDIERKLKLQSFLPTLDVKANILNKGYNVTNKMENNFLENNYKWGIKFKVPLFFREAKGEYLKTKFKIQETTLERALKTKQIENKINGYYNEALILYNQLNTIQENIAGLSLLLKAEWMKFNNGESSLFMINSREVKLMETQQKEIELRLKYHKAIIFLEWSAGISK